MKAVYIVYRVIHRAPFNSDILKVERVYATENEAEGFIENVALKKWDAKFGISMHEWELDKYPEDEEEND